MAILNEKNDSTKQTIHLMITDKCDRKCRDCCNNQYSLSDIPIITNEELSEAKHIYLTGGEPFAYGDPSGIATMLKNTYSNIEKIIVYTNAFELDMYLNNNGKLDGIDGLTISIKTTSDAAAFKKLIKNPEVVNLESNWVYVFDGFEDMECPEGFHKAKREWQKNFVAAPNSIFRRVARFK